MNLALLDGEVQALQDLTTIRSRDASVEIFDFKQGGHRFRIPFFAPTRRLNLNR
jgi:hypothetical protein